MAGEMGRHRRCAAAEPSRRQGGARPASQRSPESAGAGLQQVEEATAQKGPLINRGVLRHRTLIPHRGSTADLPARYVFLPRVSVLKDK
jgi:hypothetical protein